MLRDGHVAASITHKTELFDLISAKQTRKRGKKWKNSAFPLIFKTEGTTYIFDALCTLFCQMAAAVRQEISSWEKRGKNEKGKKWKLKSKTCKIKYESPGKIRSSILQGSCPGTIMAKDHHQHKTICFTRTLNQTENNTHLKRSKNGEIPFAYFMLFSVTVFCIYYTITHRYNSITSKSLLMQLFLRCAVNCRTIWRGTESRTHFSNRIRTDSHHEMFIYTIC